MRIGKRNIDRSNFGVDVARREIKIQIGARGSKLGTDWISFDRFDNSHLIDYAWDLHCIPIEDDAVDCYVCNAVLEHVVDSDLAIFEMFRTLKPGGRIWTEVPFSQPYHAHPSDFRRWTLSGLKGSMEDFEEISAGIVVNLASMIMPFAREVLKTSGVAVNDDALVNFENIAKGYEVRAANPRFYSGVYFDGLKSRECDREKVDFMQYRKRKYLERNRSELTYDPMKLLSTHDLADGMKALEQRKIEEVQNLLGMSP